MNVRTVPLAAWSVMALLLLVLSGACRNQARRPSDASVPSASAPSGLTPELAAQVIAKVDGRQITLGDYETAAAAAADVYAQRTGWERWDLLQENSGPRDLSEWEEVIEEEGMT